MAKIPKRVYQGLLLLAVAIALGMAGYRMYQIQQEKHDFAEAEQHIDSLAQQIEQTIGKPDETKKEKSCARASRKFEKGPLSCNVSLYLFYKDRDSLSSSELMKQIFRLSNGSFLQRLGDKSVDRFVNTSEYPGDQLIDQDYSVNGLSCGIQYTYPVIKKGSQQFTPQSPENLQIEISCGAQTKQEIFSKES